MEESACEHFPGGKRVYHSIHRKDGGNDIRVDGLQTRGFQHVDDLICG